MTHGYQDQLEGEINQKLDELASRGEVWKAPWIAHEICLEHGAGLADDQTDDRFFWSHCGYMHTRRTVTRVINKRAGSREDEDRQPTQLILAGFERDRMHDYYVVVRDGEEIGAPIIGRNQLTDDELSGKSAHYRHMGAGCFEHADEIDRFVEWRRNQPPPSLSVRVVPRYDDRHDSVAAS